MSICSVLIGTRLERPFVPSKIHDVPVKLLYDSGASVTCLSTKIFRQIPISKRPPKLPIKFKATCASGNDLKIRGYYMLTMTILEKTFKHPVVVCDNIKLDGLIGADLMRKQHLNYDAKQNAVYFAQENLSSAPKIRLKKELYIPARSRAIVNCVSEISGPQVCQIDVQEAMAVAKDEILINGPNSAICLTNVGHHALRLPKHCEIGSVEQIETGDLRKLEPMSAGHVSHTTGSLPRVSPGSIPTKLLTESRKNEILAAAKLDHLSPQDRDKYRSLLIKYHDVISLNEFELGRCNVGNHKIPLRDEKTPIYKPQFPLALTHVKEIQRQTSEWLKLGVIKRCESEYNSALFVVKKKTPEGQPQKWRIVQDFRGLNEQTLPSNLRLPLISECLDKIGEKKAKLFSSLDLRSGFYQIDLAEKDKIKTAFWVQDFGQFCWERAPQGLSFMPFSFQRIMERIFRREIENNDLICYLDDLLTYSSTMDQMIQTLQCIFEKLRQSGLLINVSKCEFGKPSLTYLGFEISENGYRPDPQKVKDILNCPAPTTVKQIRAFIGMLQFYRAHFPKFSQEIKPLSKLTGNKSGWTGGVLPLNARTSFEMFKKRLATRPILAYPDMNLKMHLYVDASLGEVENEDSGGVAACLVQYEQNDVRNKPKVLGYASRTLLKHERNYSAFLAENLAAVFGIEHFSKYLIAQRFVLHSDHQPMSKLNNNQKRTLERLKDMIAQYSFDIEYFPGRLMPADYLSRYANRSDCPINRDSNILSNTDFEKSRDSSVCAIECPGLLGTGTMQERIFQFKSEQNSDPLCLALLSFLKTKQLPSSGLYRSLAKRFGPRCLIENGLLKITLERPGRQPRTCLVLPAVYAAPVISAAHCSSYGGHSGNFKTIERILESYWLPGISTLVDEFIKECSVCCKNAKKETASKTFLKPLDPVYEPFVRLGADLFGPLQSPTGKKWILVMVDHFSKLVEFAAIKDKTADSVADALFSNWFNRYGMPVQIVTDQGSEFKNSLLDSIYKTCGIERRLASVQHAQSNSAVELVNKKVAKYLKSMIDTNVLDWESHLDAMRFSWNTAVSSATKMSPYALLFGLNPRTPMNDLVFAAKPFYGEETRNEHLMKLKLARKLAAENNMLYREEYKLKFDSTVQPEDFCEGKLVWLHCPELNKINPKLNSPFVGPFVVQTVLNQHNVVIQHLKTQRTRLVNINRLRAFRDNKEKNVNDSLEEKKKFDAENDRLDKTDTKSSQFEDSRDFKKNSLLVEQDADIIWENRTPPRPIVMKTIKQEPQQSTDLSENQTALLKSPQDDSKLGKKKSKLPRKLDIDLSPAALGSYLSPKKLTRSKAKDLDIVIPEQTLPDLPLESKRARLLPAQKKYSTHPDISE